MRSNEHHVIFAAPRRLWRWIMVFLFVLCLILLQILWGTSPGLDSALAVPIFFVALLFIISFFGTLLACYSWLTQASLGGLGSVAWMDSAGIHFKGGQGISWPEVESVFARQAATKDLLLCIKPVETTDFITRAPLERQVVMRSNLDTYGAPIYINLSAFWQGSFDDLSAKITTLTSGRLSLATGG